MKLTAKQWAGVAVVGLVAAWYVKKRAGQAVAAAAEAVTPTNRDNVFNRGFNAVTEAVTGSDRSLGIRIADWVNGSD